MSTRSNIPLPMPSILSLADATSVLLAMNAAALAETLLYGIHFILFCICTFILIRNRRLTQWFIFGSAFIMFALSTADISITIRLMTRDIVATLRPNGVDYVAKRFYPKNPIFVTNNFVAELILLYRCYMIWGRPKYLLVATSFLVLGDTVWGLLSMSQPLVAPQLKFAPVYLWSVFTINILISGISAGRIFWVSRIARPISGHHNLRHYHIVIAVLLQSGAVYSTCLLSFLLFPSHSIYRIVAMTMCMRVVAIMPTLLIVQVGLNRIVRDSVANDWERPATSIVLDTIITTMQENQDASRCNAHAQEGRGAHIDIDSFSITGRPSAVGT